MTGTCPDGHQSSATDYCDECGLSMSAQAQSAGGGSAPGGAPAAPGYGQAGEPCPNCLLPRQAGDTFCEGCGFPFSEEQTGKTVDAPSLDIEAEIRKAEEARHKAEQAQRRAEEEIRLRAEAEARPGQQNQPGPANQGTKKGVRYGGQPGGLSGPQTGPQTGEDPDSDPLARTVTADPTGSGGAPAAAGVQWIAIATADRAYYDAVVAEGEIDANAYPFPPYCPERQYELKGDTVRIGRSGKRGNVDIDLTGPPTDPGVSHLHAVLQQRPDGGWAVVDLESMNGTVLNDDTAPIPPNQAFPVEAGHRIHVGVWTTLTLIQLS